MILAELAQEAGVPDGVLNIVHGAHDTVNGILDAPEIKAISFVGGDNAGKYIHRRGTEQGKRVQSNMAAKNHCVSAGVRPNASPQWLRPSFPTHALSMQYHIDHWLIIGSSTGRQPERRAQRYRRRVRRSSWAAMHGFVCP
jgi:hypothetical protein